MGGSARELKRQARGTHRRGPAILRAEKGSRGGEKADCGKEKKRWGETRAWRKTKEKIDARTERKRDLPFVAAHAGLLLDWFFILFVFCMLAYGRIFATYLRKARHGERGEDSLAVQA